MNNTLVASAKSEISNNVLVIRPSTNIKVVSMVELLFVNQMHRSKKKLSKQANSFYSHPLINLGSQAVSLSISCHHSSLSSTHVSCLSTTRTSAAGVNPLISSLSLGSVPPFHRRQGMSTGGSDALSPKVRRKVLLQLSNVWWSAHALRAQWHMW